MPGRLFENRAGHDAHHSGAPGLSSNACCQWIDSQQLMVLFGQLT
jgi:hypothetical protein